MKRASSAVRPKPKAAKSAPDVASVDLPFEQSVGYQIRATHRALQRFLQLKIESYGVTLGMWYFLRALWHEDGLTQRELSRRVGTMEPTTLSAIQNMEREGLVRRVQSTTDRRKWHIRLTAKGKKLKADLIPLAREVVSTSVRGVPAADVRQLLKMLVTIQANIEDATQPFDHGSPPDPTS